MTSIRSVPLSVKAPRLDDPALDLLWILHGEFCSVETTPDLLNARQLNADLSAARRLIRLRGREQVESTIMLLANSGRRFGVRRMCDLLFRFDSIMSQLGAVSGGERR